MIYRGCHIDDSKEAELQRNPERARLGGFKAITAVFFQDYASYEHPERPDQSRAIGWVRGELVTVAFEIWDEEPELIHFATYWPASPAERSIYDDQKGTP